MHLLLLHSALAARLLDRVSLKDQYLSHLLPDLPRTSVAASQTAIYFGDYEAPIDATESASRDDSMRASEAERTQQTATQAPADISSLPHKRNQSENNTVCHLQDVSLADKNDDLGLVQLEEATFPLAPQCTTNIVSGRLLNKYDTAVCLTENKHELCLEIKPNKSGLALSYDGRALGSKKIVTIGENFRIKFELAYTKSSGAALASLNGQPVIAATIPSDILSPVASLRCPGGLALFTKVQVI